MAEKIDNKDSFGMPVLILAGWAVVLIAGFLANRGADIGKLGELAGNLGSSSVLGEGFFDSLFGVLTALLILGAWLGLGHFALTFLDLPKSKDHSHFLELALKVATGAFIWSLVWFLLGVTGLYSPVSAIVTVILGQLILALSLRRGKEAVAESRVPETANGFDKALLILIAIPLALAAVAALAPPTAKDTVLYHFSVPKQFIAQGSSAFIEGNIASYLALGTEMHNVWAMLLGGFLSERAGEAAAGATIWLFFPLLLAAIFGFVREIGVSRRWALIAVLMVASVPTAYHVAANAYVDLALALFVTLAVYSLTRGWKTPAAGWLVLIAIFLGAALSVKLTTLFVIAAFALIILLRIRKAQESGENIGRIAIGGFAALMLASVIASPWYLRTWSETGSPVFPFYMSIWKGEAAGWDVERSNLFQAMNSQYGGAEKSALDYLALPWNVSVAAQLERFEYFDGVLGVAFLFGLPLLIWALWKFDMPIEIKIGAGVAGIMFLFWMFSSQQLRYLLPIVPILAISIAAAGRKLAETDTAFRRVTEVSLTAAAVCGIAVSAAWFLEKAPVRVVLGGETRGEYLTRNLDYYPFYKWINTETPPDSKVWLINMRRDSYHIDRPYFSDYLFEDWTFRQMVWDSRNVGELREKAKGTGANYVLVRHDVLLDPKRSPIFDPERAATENELKMRIAREFIFEGSNAVRSDKKFSLIKVF